MRTAEGAWRLARGLAATLVAAVLGSAPGCSGSSDAYLPHEPPDASWDGSPPASTRDGGFSREAGPDRTDAEAAVEGRGEAGMPHDATIVDARIVAPSDGSPPRDASALDARAEVGSDAAARDAAPGDASIPSVGAESSAPMHDATPSDRPARVCGVPGNCIVSGALPSQSTNVLGMTMSLCPNGADAASGVCIVETNLGDATWSASASAGPSVLEGTVGVRARDIVLVVSTLLGPTTCHFALGGSAFAPVAFRIRLEDTPTPATVVGCSALTVGEVTVLGDIPATVTGGSLCSDVVLPQLRPLVLDQAEAALQRAIHQQVCLR